MDLNPDVLDVETRLRRSKRGDTVHRAECSRAGNALPWIWAEGLTDAQIVAYAAAWLKPCKICKPFRSTAPEGPKNG